ncbi:long-chain acyl-CoA synthetase [Clavibacter michiganensis]|uniref:AMP-binding protein n=1 Tax=Clavibacter michiganensis TaxID=28447 RepID=UPI001D9D03E3|nr:AMP-binding protein [Clavibacter michiganensis]MBM7411630.1 long-chain acyl-CoA synthetase [Clavibacter michiganensis]
MLDAAMPAAPTDDPAADGGATAAGRVRDGLTISAAAILAESAVRHADSVALVIGEESITYRDLWAQARAYAGALGERGVGDGTPVAVLIPNVADFPRVYYAVLALGGIVVPVHALLKAEEIAYVLRDSGARLLVCAAPLLAEGAAGAAAAGVPVLTVLAPADRPDLPPRLEDEAARATPVVSYVPRSPLDTATILYTSGTTGQPKGAEGTHLAIVMQVDVFLIDTFDMHAGDRILGCLPLFHSFGQTCTMHLAFRIGATVVLMPRFDPDAALALMVEHGTELFMGVPSMFVALLAAARRDPRRPPLRYAMSGGAAIPVAVIDAFREEFSAEIHEGYGLTETTPVASFNHVGVAPPRPGTVGTPIWGVRVEIADPAREDAVVILPRGELGEIVVRGHNVMNGYLGRPEDTARVLVDGWFRTGDLGAIDEHGDIRVVDRTSDMILRNGYNVYPREVEEVLARHPAVAQCAVFGVPHSGHGQEVVAAVVVRDGAVGDTAEMKTFVRERIASYKYPRRIEVVDALPLGPSGKVLKRRLVERFGA